MEPSQSCRMVQGSLLRFALRWTASEPMLARGRHFGQSVTRSRVRRNRCEPGRLSQQGAMLMGSNNPKTPTIARIWRGRTRPERADEYEAYNYEVGIKPLIEKALGVQTFRDDRENETEFMTISYWASVEDMASFTGSDP